MDFGRTRHNHLEASPLATKAERWDYGRGRAFVRRISASWDVLPGGASIPLTLTQKCYSWTSTPNTFQPGKEAFEEYVMSAHKGDFAESHSLNILGIDEEEERIYRWLLAHPGLTLTEVSRGLSLSPRKARAVLDSAEAKGLMTQSPESPRRYIPVSPEIALRALSFRHQEELKRVDGFIQELQGIAEAQRQNNSERMVELITSRETERQILGQMLGAAVHEVAVLVKLPVLITHPRQIEGHESQKTALARGVRQRSITDAEFLDSPGAIDELRQDIKAGEDARFFPSLPFKMVLVDRSFGLIPLNLQQPDSPVLFLHASALLDALYVLFETLWERSLPIFFDRAGIAKTGDPDFRLPEDAEELIELLAAGLNNKKIAGELGISASTLKRRMAGIMEAFNVRTRFQLGRVTGQALVGKESKDQQIGKLQ